MDTQTITNVIMIIAVFAGPIVAVRITRYLDDKKEVRERKLSIFKALMTTRATTLSPAHVEALNRIDLEFNPKIKKEKGVIDAWKEYLDHLKATHFPQDQWPIKRVDLLVELLHKMAQVLNYDFDKTTIKNSSYYPQLYWENDEIQQAIRNWVKLFFEGKIPIPMYVTNLPPANPPSEENQLTESTESSEPNL